MTRRRRTCDAQHGVETDSVATDRSTADGRAIADGGAVGGDAADDRPASDSGTIDAVAESEILSSLNPAGDSDDSGYFSIDIGAIGIGLVSVLGALTFVLGSLQALYHLSQLRNIPMFDLLQNDVVGFVAIPVALLLVWLLVGVVLIVGRSRTAPVGAAAFLIAALLNIVVFATEMLGVRPTLLWYVDPVFSIIMLPVDELLYRGIVRSEFFWHAPRFVGTVFSLLFAGYLGVQSARRYVL